MKLKDIKKVYFVGIGGIGMSAIARYFNEMGAEVWGYDKTETVLTKKLVEEGMKIHYDEHVDGIPNGIDLVVYTPAVPATHAELVYFNEQDYPVKKRAEVLGIISKGKKTIAIAGTHGKTSTSTITTHVLKVGGIDCSAFLGGIAHNYGSNFVYGKSEWVVIEADEFDRSFLWLSPDIATIMSLDADHLDIYGDLEQMMETGFKAFVKNLKPNGQLLVVNREKEQFEDFEQVVSFGIEQGDVRATNVSVENGFFVFDYESEKIRIRDIVFSLPGRHNIENALAAITIAVSLGVKAEAIREALKSFKGIKRRFDRVFVSESVVYIDDYAHHPSELKAAIAAARELYPGKKLTGIFQPHLFSRTQDFSAGFAAALDGLDELLLLDIYPAREAPIPGVTSDLILRQMKIENKQLCQKDTVIDELKKRDLEVVLTLGAGDIDQLVPKLLRLLSSKPWRRDW